MRTFILLAIALHQLTLGACAHRDPPPHAVNAVSESRPQSPLKDAALVLDVRTSDEYAAGHLEGALHIPVTELPSRLAEVDAALSGDKSRKVVTYCKSGKRAEQAKLALESHGYTNVINGGGYDQLKP